jgi:hypothetical protein
MKRSQVFGILMAACILMSNTSVAIGLETRPQAILYIAAEPGCYSATYVTSTTVPMKAPKKLYPVSCYSKHHFEVFWAGQVETQPGNPIPTSKTSAKFCVEKGDKLTVLGRGPTSYNYGLYETTGTGNWLADKGPEAKRYPKRLVCYIGLSTNEFRYFKEISQPLIKGLQ